ncbi:MAG: hypothetical protein ACI867_000433 [Glaciecola sp.]|jgi:hypothetical protein
MDEFRDSTPDVSDTRALRARLADEGYLFFRGLLPHDAAEAVRLRILQELARHGWLRDGSQASDQLPGSLARPEMDDSYWDGYTAMQSVEAFHELAHEPSLLSMVGALIDEDVLVHPRKIGRVSYPFGMAPTPPHQDFRYIQGTVDTFTAWTPLGDCPADLGGLRLLRGSQNRGLLPVDVAAGAGGLGVATREDDSDWASAEFFTGDVLLFHSLTVHGARANHQDRLRLSVDYRYQAASEPVVRGTMHPHFHPNVPDWPELTTEWKSSASIKGEAASFTPMLPPADDLDLPASRFVRVEAVHE